MHVRSSSHRRPRTSQRARSTGLHPKLVRAESPVATRLSADPRRGCRVRRGLLAEQPAFQRLSARERFPPGQVSDLMAPSGNPRVIFVEINMPSELVELRGQLSDSRVTQVIRGVHGIFGHAKTEACRESEAIALARRRPFAERLGQQVIHEYLHGRQTGTTQQTVADRYGISVSSVKRLLRDFGTRRPDGPQAIGRMA